MLYWLWSLLCGHENQSKIEHCHFKHKVKLVLYANILGCFSFSCIFCSHAVHYFSIYHDDLTIMFLFALDIKKWKMYCNFCCMGIYDFFTKSVHVFLYIDHLPIRSIFTTYLGAQLTCEEWNVRPQHMCSTVHNVRWFWKSPKCFNCRLWQNFTFIADGGIESVSFQIKTNPTFLFFYFFL